MCDILSDRRDGSRMRQSHV